MKNILILFSLLLSGTAFAYTKFDFTAAKNFPLQTYFTLGKGTFSGNDAFFNPANVILKPRSPLILQIAKEQMGDRQYTGAEVKLLPQYAKNLYGRYEVVMKAACQSGTVSAFFLYNSVPSWQEIDFELIGSKPNIVQTSYVYNGNLSDNGDPNNYHARQFDVGVNTCLDFHHYAFEWEPGVIRFYFDGKLIDERRNEWGDRIPDQPLNLYMNAWLNNSPYWAGPIDPNLNKTQMAVKEIVFP